MGPLLKKDGLPPVFKNFRPVSNLAFVSKLVETVVAKQLQHYLNCNNLFPVFQSPYLQHHSTESALLKVMNDILLNMNSQYVTLLILLDLSAAFDTVNHDTILRRLEYSFVIQGKALSWFASYLSGRIQRIMINESLSKPFLVRYCSRSTRVSFLRLLNIICPLFTVTLMIHKFTSHLVRTTELNNMLW